MATWKKVVVSGSAISQLNNDSNYLVDGQSGASLTGSFTGSFVGDGSQLTGIVFTGTASFTVSASHADNADNAISASYALSASQAGNANTATSASYALSSSQAGNANTATSASYALSASYAVFSSQSMFAENAGSAGSAESATSASYATFAESANTANSATTAATASYVASAISASRAVSAASADFATSASIATGAGTAITASHALNANNAISASYALLATTASYALNANADLSFSGSTGVGAVDLASQVLSIVGTSNEIETAAGGTTLTIGLPNDVTIGQDLIVSRNLTVLGTASFQNTTNLDVADRFILMASGSNTTGDGGIVIQQGTQGVGEAFAWDAATTRWAVTGSFDASQATFVPEAFMSAVIEGAASDPTAVVAKLTKKGNIFVAADETIWIYS